MTARCTQSCDSCVFYRGERDGCRLILRATNESTFGMPMKHLNVLSWETPDGIELQCRASLPPDEWKEMAAYAWEYLSSLKNYVGVMKMHQSCGAYELRREA